MFWFKHANTKKHVSKHSWLSGWVILNILAHIAHSAQAYFSLIFSAINTHNCSYFDLTNKKICSDWRWKLGENWPMLTTFFLIATVAITGIYMKSIAVVAQSLHWGGIYTSWCTRGGNFHGQFIFLKNLKVINS